MHPDGRSESDERHPDPLGQPLHDPSHLVLEHGELLGGRGRIDDEDERRRPRAAGLGGVRGQRVLDAGVGGEELGGERVGGQEARERVGGGAAEGAGPARGAVVHAGEGVERGAATRGGAAERRVGEQREEVGRRGVLQRRAEDGGGHDERGGGGGIRRPRVPRPPEALHGLQLREVHRDRRTVGGGVVGVPRGGVATRVCLRLPVCSPLFFFCLPASAGLLGFLSSSGEFWMYPFSFWLLLQPTG